VQIPWNQYGTDTLQGQLGPNTAHSLPTVYFTSKPLPLILTQS